MPPARKYLPLLAHLEALSTNQESESLTFDQIEEMLGEQLPQSAWLGHYWAGSSVARYNWERSGFRAKLDRLGRQVVFTRQDLRVT